MCRTLTAWPDLASLQSTCPNPTHAAPPLHNHPCPSPHTATHLPPPIACSSAATCVVLLPGAAQQSMTSQPLLGFRAWAGMQLDLLCTKRQKEAGVEECGE